MLHTYMYVKYPIYYYIHTTLKKLWKIKTVFTVLNNLQSNLRHSVCSEALFE